MIERITLDIDGDTYETNTLSAVKGVAIFTKLASLLGAGVGNDGFSIGALAARLGEPGVDKLIIDLCDGLQVNKRMLDFGTHFSGKGFGRLIPVVKWLITENFGTSLVGLKDLLGTQQAADSNPAA